jgi:flotillin
MSNEIKKYFEDKGIIKKIALVGTGLGITGFFIFRYKTSQSYEWLVRTGLGISDMEIGKKFIHWPFQNIQNINLTPMSLKFNVNAMSKEKMEFAFPGVFTVGPKNELESLNKYARYLLSQRPEDIEHLIRGIIEGETRTLAANLSIEDIFTGRSEFKSDIISHAKSQLDQYGLEIYNANIEELKDSETSNYFRSLSQKIKSEAENKAKVEVAEQNKKGNIGSKEREAETRQRIAIVESDTQLVENKRKQEIFISQAEMEKTKAEQTLVVKSANIKMEQDAEALRLQMLRDVEMKRQEMELEKQRANELTKTKVQAEMLLKEAEGKANYMKVIAEADLYKTEKEAEAYLYKKIKESEGIIALYNAQSEGLKKMVESFGGDIKGLLNYTMMEKGIYEKLAEANAKAIKDMNPKITVWTGDGSKAMEPIANLGKSIIPMLDTIKDQTGYSLPEWMIKDKNN